jgi:hypothetical protein
MRRITAAARPHTLLWVQGGGPLPQWSEARMSRGPHRVEATAWPQQCRAVGVTATFHAWKLVVDTAQGTSVAERDRCAGLEHLVVGESGFGHSGDLEDRCGGITSRA